MPNFLVQPNEPLHEMPAGFVLLENFVCPNCGQTVRIASTANTAECREEINTVRNAVTLQCPLHNIAIPVCCRS